MAAKKPTPAPETPKTSATPAKKAPAKKAAAKKAAAAKEAPAKKAPAKKAAKQQPAASLTHEDIQQAAYLNYRSRKEKGTPGDQHGDWLAAERRLLKGK